MRFPDVHGDRVVFTYAGDLWLSGLDGGAARRLTSSPGLETNAKFSPDGSQIAFTAQYEGASDVYVIGTEGGEPKRLTFDPEPDNVMDWTPDGKIAYSSTNGSFVNRQPRLWYVNPEGGLPIRTVIAECAQASFFADGKRMAFNRQSSNVFNWRRYRGGTQGRVSFYNFETNQYSELPSGREQSHNPMVVGNTVFFISDRNQGTQNLYRYELDTKKETQITKYTDADIKWPATDGKNIVFERDGYLYRYDIAANTFTTVKPDIKGENLWSRPYVRPVANQIANMALSPSGQRLLVEARGELFSVPAKNGDTRNVTGTSGTRERFPAWSPNGKHLAYVSDASGYYEVHLQPQLGGEAQQLTTAKLPISSIEFSPDSQHLLLTTEANEAYLLEIATKKLTKVVQFRYGGGGFEFSPDTKWIVWTQGLPSGMSAVMLYDIATGKVSQATSGRYVDGSATFDQNGKYLYVTSTRTFNPTFGAYEFSLKVENGDRVYVIPLSKETGNPLVAPGDEEPEASAPRPPAGGPGGGAPAAPSAPATKIDLEGLESRMIPLPYGAGQYGILGVANGVLVFDSGTVTKFDLNSREPVPIATGMIGRVTTNATRTKVAYQVGPVIGIADIRPGLAVGAGRVDTTGVEITLSPRDEWKQMFWEAWRFEKTNFYDEGMRGQDWDAIGKRYAAYLPYVNHRSDLSYIFGLMLSELGTGHSYVQGGDFGPGPTPLNVGQLGVDFEATGNSIRFKKIYRGEIFEEGRRGPLGDPGVNVAEGEYLIAIDGRPVNRTVHPNSLLLGKAGRFVTLTVNSTPSTEGARKVRVRTIASEANLRYVSFVEECRQKVEKASGGRIGYMHVPNTAFEGSVEFIRGFYSQTDKDALIVDERWNGGGYIQPWFVDTLARKQRIGIQPRHSEDTPEAPTIDGPKAILINGYAGSGGDFFPWMFRQSKLGPLIGTRTWGGLVGISAGAPLVDGGSVTAPSFSLFDREKNEIIAENTGIDPDIEVDARPDLWAKGQDPQLEKAIEYLMEQLAKLPPKKKRTVVPQVGPKGRVGG
jgi:tricorn protease